MPWPPELQFGRFIYYITLHLKRLHEKLSTGEQKALVKKLRFRTRKSDKGIVCLRPVSVRVLSEFYVYLMRHKLF